MNVNCKNCDTPLNGKFCSNCGQKADVHRITIPHLLHELIHALTHADKGFLLLIKDLLWRPGYVAKEYIEGKRKKYYNPLSFLVLTTAFSAFIAYKSGYYANLSSRRPGREPIRYFNETMHISVEHGKLLGLILIVPALTFFCWLFFRKPRYNFAEHFVIQSFTTGMMYLVTAVVFVPLFLLWPSTLTLNNMAMQLVSLVYLIVTYKQLLQRNIIIITLKSILIKVLFIVVFWLMIYAFVYTRHLLTT